MKAKTLPLILAAVLAPLAIKAQQPPSPQPTQAQAQPVPCVTTPTTPNPSGNQPAVKVPNKWRQMLDKQRQQLENKIGVPIPDVATSIEQAANSKPAPCPAQAAAPKAPQPVAIPHLPSGVITTWLCNPIVTSTDPSHTVTFITPDALTVAEPAQPGVFEADGAKADPRATTVSCANLRRDPKNNKVFLAQ
jgi:hypothetical protein